MINDVLILHKYVNNLINLIYLIFYSITNRANCWEINLEINGSE